MGVVVALIIVFAAAVMSVRGTNTWLVGTMATVNGTSNSVSMVMGTMSLPPGFVVVNNGGLNNTNDLTVRAQISLDDTNFVTVSTWQPTTTNAGSAVFAPMYAAQTLRIRIQVVTTNAINVGVLYQN